MADAAAPGGVGGAARREERRFGAPAPSAAPKYRRRPGSAGITGVCPFSSPWERGSARVVELVVSALVRRVPGCGGCRVGRGCGVETVLLLGKGGQEARGGRSGGRVRPAVGGYRGTFRGLTPCTWRYPLSVKAISAGLSRPGDLRGVTGARSMAAKMGSP